MNLEIADRIGFHYEQLSATEKRIAKYIKESDPSVCHLSIQALADAIETSPSAITRFVKKIGYNTYQELRLQLAEQPEQIEGANFPSILEDDSILNIAQAAFHCGIHSFQSTYSILNEHALMDAIQILQHTRNCGVFGLGSSQIMAKAFCQRFLRTSLNTKTFEDFHMQLMIAGSLNENDCAVILSHSGKNDDLLRIVDILKERNVPIITISTDPSNLLIRKSDVFLFCVSERTNDRLEMISSSISHLILIDTLFTLYAVKVDTDPTYFSNIRKIINITRQ